MKSQLEKWSSDFKKAPTEHHHYFVVRARGRDGRTMLPTVVQRIDGELYSPENELDPLYFGQNEADDHPLKTTLEWQPLPASWEWPPPPRSCHGSIK